MRLKIVYDNEALPGYTSNWGFSCFLEAERVLFDTGTNGSILLSNMSLLGVDPASIEKVVLSHAHQDHTGGLRSILERNKKAKVYVLPSFPSSLKEEAFGHEIVEVGGPTEVCGNVTATGQIGGGIPEQSLAIRTKEGQVVITGCAHPGLDRILDFVSSLGPVYGAIGGFHGFSELRRLEGMGLIMPCHCTSRKKEIHKLFPENAVECSAGKIVDLPD